MLLDTNNTVKIFATFRIQEMFATCKTIQIMSNERDANLVRQHC